MKEIIKYLRRTNSFTQEEIARRLGISRQSYIKYENGEVEPGDRIIRALSIIYDVDESFIRRNEVPKPGHSKKSVTYEIKPEGELYAASPSVIPYSASPLSQERLPDGRRIFEGIFDGTFVRILDSIEGLKLKKGQKVKLYVETEEEDMKERKEALKSFFSLAKKGKPCTLQPDEDPYYKEALYKALEEEYGTFDTAD